MIPRVLPGSRPSAIARPTHHRRLDSPTADADGQTRRSTHARRVGVTAPVGAAVQMAPRTVRVSLTVVSRQRLIRRPPVADADVLPDETRREGLVGRGYGHRQGESGFLRWQGR